VKERRDTRPSSCARPATTCSATGFALAGSDAYCATPPQFWRDRAIEAESPRARPSHQLANISVFGGSRSWKAARTPVVTAKPGRDLGTRCGSSNGRIDWLPRTYFLFHTENRREARAARASRRHPRWTRWGGGFIRPTPPARSLASPGEMARRLGRRFARGQLREKAESWSARTTIDDNYAKAYGSAIVLRYWSWKRQLCRPRRCGRRNLSASASAFIAIAHARIKFGIARARRACQSTSAGGGGSEVQKSQKRAMMRHKEWRDRNRPRRHRRCSRRGRKL